MNWDNDRESTNEEFDLAMALQEMEKIEEELQIVESEILSRQKELIQLNEFLSKCSEGNDEGGGKDVSARPTRTACEWMREEGVIN